MNNNQKGGSIMSKTINTQISAKVNKFFYRLNKYLSLPRVKFLKDIVVGTIKTGDVHIYPVAKSLGEDKRYKNTDKRLRRNIGCRNLWRQVIDGFLCTNKVMIDRMRYLVVDGGDIQKRYALKMEQIGRVRDGDKGRIGNGYWLLNILGVSSDRCSIVNIFSELYSYQQYIGSMNSKLFSALEIVFSEIQRAGKVLVFDRDYDRQIVIERLLKWGNDFVVRLTRKRHLSIGKKKLGYQGWQKTVALTKQVILAKVTRSGRLKRVKYRAGVVKVRLPAGEYKDKFLWLLVMKKQGHGIKKDQGFSYFLGYFSEEMTDLEVLGEMIKAYGSRWRIEEYYRQVKVNFKIESISLHRYEALKNMITIVLVVVSYFVTCVYKKLMMAIIESKMSKRELRRYYEKRLQYIYYRVFEELSKLFNRIDFRRKIKYPSLNKSLLLSLFPEWEASL
jgi:hypothetical protein